MPYATLADLRAYLPQLPADITTDTLLTALLTRATDAVIAVLGFDFAGYATSEELVRGSNSPYLPLPAHRLGSVDGVEDVRTGATVPFRQWSNGVLERDEETLADCPAVWGAPLYRVTAAWGYGPPPPSISQVVLEVSVQWWRAKDAARFAEVVGVQREGAVSIEAAFTPPQAAVLGAWKRKFARVGV